MCCRATASAWASSAAARRSTSRRRMRRHARRPASARRTPSRPPSSRPAARTTVCSRSRTTTEVLDAVAVIGERVPTAAITAVPGSPLAQAAGRVVTLPFADEQSVVQTRFATATLVLLRAHTGIDSTPAVAAAEVVLERPLPIDPAGFDRFHFLGRGWAVGLAHEAALKLREAARAWSEAYPAMEYRHGPIAIADSRTLVVPIGEFDPELESDIRATGATLLEPEAEPLASVVLAHRLAIALAHARGLDPSNPRNLTR